MKRHMKLLSMKRKTRKYLPLKGPFKIDITGGGGLKSCHFAMANKPFVTLLGREGGKKSHFCGEVIFERPLKQKSHYSRVKFCIYFHSIVYFFSPRLVPVEVDVNQCEILFYHFTTTVFKLINFNK